VFEFEWHEAKRLANIEKHDIDFRRARLLFDGRTILITLVPKPVEIRLSAIGELDGRMVTAYWTIRGRMIRLISVRRARREERRKYRQLYG
jgi:uncharacterized DUF497 family protein